MEKFEIRVLLKFFWKKGLSSRAAVKEISQVEGEGFVSKSSAARWFKKFNEGDISLEDQERPGRPPTLDSKVLREAVERNPSTSTRRLSAELGSSQSTIIRQLHKLGKVNKRCREVPHELSFAQAQHRIDTCKKLLQNSMNERWMKRVVTCDEKWIYFSNPNKENQWLDPGQEAYPVAKRDRFSKKVMLCVWWNFEGVIHFELVANNRAINAELYTDQLDRMYTALGKKYPALINRKQVILQQDNASPHTAALTRRKIEELEAIELLPHPAYSPDLAPSDFHLFRAMSHFLKGRSFSDIDDVDNGCREFFASKDKTWYRRGIEQLAERWVQCIEHNGLYFES
jgi:[histone H3]-lysine36 N-dimethyltransferase SETMAR